MKHYRESILGAAAEKIAEIWASEPAEPFKIELLSSDMGRLGIAWREVRSTGTFEVERDGRGWLTRTTSPSSSVSRHRIETRIARLLVGEALLNPRGTIDLAAVGRPLIGGGR